MTVYWRPGCPYCSSLRRGLRRAGVDFAEIDIWADPKAAAVVRSLAGGNETVPTVVVGDSAYVNPSWRAVLAAVVGHGPGGDGVAESRWRSAVTPGRLARWLVVACLLVASEVVSHSGNVAASYGIDGAAVAAYAGLRRWWP